MCKLCARESDELVDTRKFGEVSSEERLPKRRSLLFISSSLETNNFDENDRNNNNNNENNNSVSRFFLHFEKSFCPTTTERGEKTSFEKKISL